MHVVTAVADVDTEFPGDLFDLFHFAVAVVIAQLVETGDTGDESIAIVGENNP